VQRGPSHETRTYLDDEPTSNLIVGRRSSGLWRWRHRISKLRLSQRTTLPGGYIYHPMSNLY